MTLTESALHRNMWSASNIKILNGNYRVDKDLFFFAAGDGGKRGHSRKLFKRRCRPDIRKFAFSKRIVDNWNSLSDDCVSCTMLNNFISHIGLHWDWKPYTDFTGAGQSLYARLYYTYVNNVIMITYQTQKWVSHAHIHMLVVLAQISQLGKLFHVFTTLLVKQYFCTSYLKRVF